MVNSSPKKDDSGLSHRWQRKSIYHVISISSMDAVKFDSGFDTKGSALHFSCKVTSSVHYTESQISSSFGLVEIYHSMMIYESLYEPTIDD